MPPEQSNFAPEESKDVANNRQEVVEFSEPLSVPPLYIIEEPRVVTHKPEFDPAEELRAVHRVPAEMRRQALDEYTSRYVEQKEDLAVFQTQVMDLVRQNPDIDQMALYEYCRQRSDELGFSPKQRTTINWAIEGYCQRHALVEHYRQSYPDDYQLFEAIFKQPAHGAIEVITGPMTFYFRCHDPQDYTYIHSQKWVTGQAVNSDDFQEAMRSGGVSLGELSGILLAENSQGRRFDWAARSTMAHEEQHAFARLLTSTSRKVDVYDQRYRTYSELLGTFDPEEQARLITRYFRLIRMERIDMRAQDELLANFVEGRYGEEVIDDLLKPEREGGLYDYESQNIDHFSERFGQIVNQIGQDKSSMTYRIYTTVIHDEYRKLLESASTTLGNLLVMGYSRDQIIGLLLHEPLHRWRKVEGQLGGELAKSMRQFDGASMNGSV